MGSRRVQKRQRRHPCWTCASKITILSVHILPPVCIYTSSSKSVWIHVAGSPKDRSLIAHKLIKIQRIQSNFSLCWRKVGNSKPKRTNYIHSNPIVKSNTSLKLPSSASILEIRTAGSRGLVVVRRWTWTLEQPPSYPSRRALALDVVAHSRGAIVVVQIDELGDESWVNSNCNHFLEKRGWVAERYLARPFSKVVPPFLTLQVQDYRFIWENKHFYGS